MTSGSSLQAARSSGILVPIDKTTPCQNLNARAPYTVSHIFCLLGGWGTALPHGSTTGWSATMYVVITYHAPFFAVHFPFLKQKIYVRADIFFNGELFGLFPPNLLPSKITIIYCGCWKNKTHSSHDSYIRSRRFKLKKWISMLSVINSCHFTFQSVFQCFPIV
jgi:hypothetical protein